jgi:hypothetical protein
VNANARNNTIPETPRAMLDEQLKIRRWARIELLTELAAAFQTEADGLPSDDPRRDWLFAKASAFQCSAQDMVR